MIVETPRAVDNEIVETIQLVTGNNKEFLPSGGAIKQTKQRRLIIFVSVRAVGLVKLVKENHTLLLHRIDKTCNAGVTVVYDDHRIAFLQRLHAYKPCKH